VFEAGKSIALLDELHRVAAHPTTRVRIPNRVRQLVLRIGLQFVGQIKGKKRQVRRRDPSATMGSKTRLILMAMAIRSVLIMK
jgi:hypothetical protein